MIRRRTPYPTGAGGTNTPSYTAATFSALPAAATSGQRCTVTGETGLSGLVCVNTAPNTWEVETVAATYALIAAVEWGATPGEWYNTGGIAVTTAAGAVASDTTNGMVWVWDAANTQFVPRVVYAGTIAGVQKIKGDSAAPSGWTVGDTDGSGTASITTAGGKVTLSASTSAVFVATSAALTYADASLSSAGNFYFRAMIQQTISGRTAQARVTLWDGTNASDIGNCSQAGTTIATGAWFDAALGSRYTAQSSSQLDLTSAEKLVEIVKIGTSIAGRVAGGVWHDLVTTGARASATKQVGITASAVSDTGAATAVTITVRHVASMRF